MNANTRMIFIWAAFWLSVILTWVFYSNGWMMVSYQLVLSVLAIISVSFALWILITNHFARRSVILVVLGLVIGQWWLVQQLIMFTLWGIRGFAP